MIPVGDDTLSAVAPEGVVPPKQERSRVTYERILDACDELLRSRRFDEISVNDLCIAADVSASSLYGRFTTKEAVLLALSERHRLIAEEAVARAVEQVAAAGAPDGDLVPAARYIVGRYLEWFRANAHIENAIDLDARAKAQVRKSEEQAIRSAAELVVSIIGPADSALARRIEVAVRVITSAVQRAVAEPRPWAARMRLDDEQLVAELVDMARLYVAAAAPGSRDP